MLVCALCSFEQTFLPGLAVSDGEIFGRLLAGCQWSDGLDNSVGVCIIVCVCVSLGVSMLCVAGIDQPLPKSSNATPHPAAATNFSSFKVNKLMFVTRFLKSLELHVI